MDNAKPLSISAEDYLEKIYLISQKNKEVRVTDIAKELKISKPSVNRAIASLSEDGYLEHEYYGRIVLTEKGKKVGENIYETHKVLKKFLSECLGVDEKIAEREACGMEHYMSKNTRKKLKKFTKKLLKK